MSEYENLMRGSAVLCVKVDSQGNKRLGIGTPRHIVHPFATSYYFPNADWLRMIEPAHLKFNVSVYSPHDGPIWQLELDPKALVVHPTLDLALFAFPLGIDCDWFLDQLLTSCQQAWITPKPFIHNPAADFPGVEPVTCVGFDYAGAPDGNVVIKENRGKIIDGRILSTQLEPCLRRAVDTDGSELAPVKDFRVETEQILQFGMCGGSVVLSSDPSHLVGIIEGIEPENGTVHCLPAGYLWELFPE